MRWYWRAAIALTVGSVHTWLACGPDNMVWRFHILLWNASFALLERLTPNPDRWHVLVVTICQLPTLVTTLATYAILPVIWSRHQVRRRRRKGHCQRCGYDLTGNTSGVCPECGERI